MPDLLFSPVPHDQAANFIRSKPILAKAAFDQLLPDLRARAFVITGVESANIVQAVRDRIADLPQGADWDAVKEDVAAQISPWLDTEESNGSERRAELLLRTHGMQAYSAAQFEVMNRQRDAFPFWQYLTMEDERVRDSHAALDQLVLPADSSFWADHYPPWDWGCRCQIVPLQADDVADIQAEDADQPPEAQRVLDDVRLKELEKNNRLIMAGNGGMPQFISTAPNPNYTFTPATLKMNAADLRGRYDPETWTNFETWAKAQRLDSGETVWEWLNKTDQPAPRPRPVAARPPIKPTVARVVPAAAAKSPEPQPARSAPVSAALKVKTTARHAGDIRTAISAVDRVHDDGDLPEIPVTASAGGSRGAYRYRKGGAPENIGVANLPDVWPGLTTAHEIGHFIDHQVLGTRGLFASESAPGLSEFRSAVESTAALRELRAIMRPKELSYYIDPKELWARAYAQYIAQRSGDPLLLEQLGRARAGLRQPAALQWTDSDFTPVATAIDKLFRAKGWIA